VNLVQPIVEGHGEVEAVPVMIRRLAGLMGVSWVEVGKPIRRPRSDFFDQHRLARAVELACMKPGCSAIIAICDADDDCPKDAAPRIHKWLASSAAGKACSLVLPKREFEAWFLASLPTLKGKRGIRDITPLGRHPESIRNAKGELERRMVKGRGYNERHDQPALVAATDWSLVYSGTRSGRKLIEEMRRLLSSLGHQPNSWPVT
jgi:hypothetical protein